MSLPAGGTEAAAAGADGIIAEADITESLMPLVRELIGPVRADRVEPGSRQVKEVRLPTMQDPPRDS
jgi:hypothetical protein